MSIPLWAKLSGMAEQYGQDIYYVIRITRRRPLGGALSAHGYITTSSNPAGHDESGQTCVLSPDLCKSMICVEQGNRSR